MQIWKRPLPHVITTGSHEHDFSAVLHHFLTDLFNSKQKFYHYCYNSASESFQIIFHKVIICILDLIGPKQSHGGSYCVAEHRRGLAPESLIIIIQKH